MKPQTVPAKEAAKPKKVIETPAPPPERDASIATGKAAREVAPLTSHSDFNTDAPRDPIGLIIRQDETRIPELVPIRHARMLVSPFTFYRGAALPMAADLAHTPSSGLRVQLCGDAHLSNFGAFGSPERRLVFDINDFDETLPGPFEWDVKRLVTSIVVASRDNGFNSKQCRAVALETAAMYRTAMREFAQMPSLQVWYSRMDVESEIDVFRTGMTEKERAHSDEQIAKARARDGRQAIEKLTTVIDGRRRIVSNPPLVVADEDIADRETLEAMHVELREVIRRYGHTLHSSRRHLLEQYKLTQIARKVVGVGSVGTQSWILLMEPLDGLEPLLLQAKQASRSVLADYAGESEYDNQGERVVNGQQLMQTVSDIFLGWQRVDAEGRPTVDYYVRQLRDWKFAVTIERLQPRTMAAYGKLCGWTLARAHARSGDRLAIGAYLGSTDKFDQAVADFAETYADQNERDYAELVRAAADGRIEVNPEGNSI
jgi:uncharacterized protein (DUF2252 family)